jgi:type I restriction enzyme M protein
MRANVPKLTKKSRPMVASQFADFERCFGDDPNGRGKRSQSDSHDDRWRCFSIKEIEDKHYKLDAFKWLRDEEFDNPDDLPEPEELITEAMEELQFALDDLSEIQRLLDGNGAAA